MFICELCNKEFKTIFGYNGHKTLAHKRPIKKCDKCDREILIGAGFTKHVEVCKGKIFCKNCHKQLITFKRLFCSRNCWRVWQLRPRSSVGLERRISNPQVAGSIPAEDAFLICEKCNREFKNRGAFKRHTDVCKKISKKHVVKIRKLYLEKKFSTRDLLNSGYARRDIIYALKGIMRNVNLAIRYAFVKHPVKLSAKTKKQMSISRKKWLKENRNNHNWRYQKEQYPEKRVREWLENLETKHIIKNEYTPEDFVRNYKFDFAVLNLKIDIEINGNQHYDKKGNLVPGHLKRQQYIYRHGWRTINIPAINVLKDFNATMSKLLDILNNDTFKKVINFPKYAYIKSKEYKSLKVTVH